MGVSKSSITPNIDKLIKNGTYFSQSITAADGTIISLNAMFTSKFPFRTGTRAEKIILEDNNYFDIIKKSEYHIYGFVPDTLAFSKFLNYCENDNAGYYYTRNRRLLNFEGILEGLGEKMINILSSNKMKEPWFFFAHTIDLHFPLNVPEEFNDEKFGDNPYERVLSALDQWIGKFIEKIGRTNTLVLLSGDHGALIPFENKGTSDFEPEMKTELKIGKKLRLKINSQILSLIHMIFLKKNTDLLEHKKNSMASIIS